MLPLAELPNVKNCLGKYAKDLGEIDVHNIEWICDLIKRVLASGSTSLHDLYVKMPISCNDGFTAFRRLIDMVDCPVMVRYISPKLVAISEEFEKVKQKICDVEKFYRDSYNDYVPALDAQTKIMEPGRDRLLMQMLLNHVQAWRGDTEFCSQRRMIEDYESVFEAQNKALKRLVKSCWDADNKTALQCLYEARQVVFIHLRSPRLTIVK